MKSKDIVRKFIEYFTERKYKIEQSSSVIPDMDDSILFVNAGMNQFKDFFTCKKRSDVNRLFSIQKCIRAGGKHNDIENVGFTSRHLTYFEMLGNFIVSNVEDNIRDEAIRLAYDFTVNHLMINKDSIWASVHFKDKDSKVIWGKYIDSDRIVELDDDSNFWQMGDSGPCGYCSEILIDRGEQFGDALNPKQDLSGERFLEIWNLVFMSFEKKNNKIMETGSILLDTGAGLERIAMLLQDKNSVFEIDKFESIIFDICELQNTKISESNKHAYYIIADHISSASIIISDGVLPSGSDRGYVLRKIMKRAFHYSRSIFHSDEPVVHKFVKFVAEHINNIIPNRIRNISYISNIFLQEEKQDISTYIRNKNIFMKMIQGSINKKLSGSEIFKLKDTFGMSVQDIKDMAEQYNVLLDLDGFFEIEAQNKNINKLNERQSMIGALIEEDTFAKLYTQFIGYDHLSCESEIIYMLDNFKQVTQVITVKNTGYIVMNKTCFYPEQGGQISDIGYFVQNTGKANVIGANKIDNCIVLEILVIDGTIIHGRSTSYVDVAYRRANCRAHTATHILNYALKQVLNSDIRQAGSKVSNDKLRFDFVFDRPISKDEIKKIEEIINEKIFDNVDVVTNLLKYSDVKNRSDVVQIFEEKYSDDVRLVSIGDFSNELCGGTHCFNTSEIGNIRIILEKSSSSGVRRIEAVCGKLFLDIVKDEQCNLQKIKDLLKVNKIEDVLPKIKAMNERVEQDVAKINQLKMQIARERALIEINNINVFDYNVCCFINDKNYDLDIINNIANIIFDELNRKFGDKNIFVIAMYEHKQDLLDIKILSNGHAINIFDMIDKNIINASKGNAYSYNVIAKTKQDAIVDKILLFMNNNK